MISSLKDKLSDIFEPAAAAWHGWRHFQRCVPEHKKPSLERRKVVIEALLVQGSFYVAAGLLGAHPHESQAYLKVGLFALTPSAFAAFPMMQTLKEYGRAHLKHQHIKNQLKPR